MRTDMRTRSPLSLLVDSRHPPRAAKMGVQPGEVLAGKYRVERVLGEGGMGVVVAATHLQLHQTVALKFMLPDAARKAHTVERFLREARAAVRLHSQHVARVLDVALLPDGVPYIVMEYLEGSDLETLLSHRGRLPVDEAAEYIFQACDAIAEAHSLGIVHRDLKPANLFITNGPRGEPLIKVLDFGISKGSHAMADTGVALTKSAELIGTPRYMAPEQMTSARTVDGRADIWSLGAILFELITGRIAFDGDSLGAVFNQVLHGSPLPLRQLAPEAPYEFEQLVMRCLEKDPARRFPHIGEFGFGLSPFARSRTDESAARFIQRFNSSRPPPFSSVPPPPGPSVPVPLIPSAPALPSMPLSRTENSWGRSMAGPVPGRSSRAIVPTLAVIFGIAVLAASALGLAVWLRARLPPPSTNVAAAPTPPSVMAVPQVPEPRSSAETRPDPTPPPPQDPSPPSLILAAATTPTAPSRASAVSGGAFASPHPRQLRRARTPAGGATRGGKLLEDWN
jgi:serine/threonine-protein kinase